MPSSRPTERPPASPLPVSPAHVALFARAFAIDPRVHPALDHEAIRAHLEGSVTLDVDPAVNDVCHYVTLSFRRKKGGAWKTDAVDFAAASAALGVPVLLEALSGSNPGLRAWVFLEEETPVLQARRLASALLMHASGGDIERIGSFSEIVPGPTPGTLSLPLGGVARHVGGGLFVEGRRGLGVLPDQAAVLASIRRVSASTVASLVEGGERRAVRRPALSQVDVVRSASLVLSRPLPPGLARRLRRRLTFPNPRGLKRPGERRARPSRRLLPGWTRADGAWRVPRGLFEQVAAWCEEDGVRCEVLDVRWRWPALPRLTGAVLAQEARALAEVALRSESGVVIDGDDFVRTSVAFAVVAERGQPTLVLTTNPSRRDHWREQALLAGFEPHDVRSFEEAGPVDAPLVLATYSDVRRCATEVDGPFGMVVADDCHRVPLDALWEALEAVPAAHVLGLSADRRREDGLDRMVEMLVGPVLRAREQGRDDVVEVVTRHTRFTHTASGRGQGRDADRVTEVESGRLFDDPEALPTAPEVRTARADLARDWNALIDAISHDGARNEMVVDDAVHECVSQSPPGLCLVLTTRKEHARVLQAGLESRGVASAVLTGDLGRSDRHATLERVRASQVSALVVIDSMLGAGFDASAVTRLLLAAPPRSEGQVQRIMERFKNLTRLYDYVDDAVPALSRRAASRRRLYVQSRTDLNADATQLRLPFDAL
ncbi:MAG: hypothetical protein EB084_00410 [Proteobacteria bacterium]|nr:hypothetical protein [Pseudomonadota bacterium]